MKTLKLLPVYNSILYSCLCLQIKYAPPSFYAGGESGSADTVRDPRGFAIKFYTEEGNWDLVGNNTPIFFIRDPILVRMCVACEGYSFAVMLIHVVVFIVTIGAFYFTDLCSSPVLSILRRGTHRPTPR